MPSGFCACSLSAWLPLVWRDRDDPPELWRERAAAAGPIPEQNAPISRRILLLAIVPARRTIAGLADQFETGGVRLPNVDFRHVRRRLEFLLETQAGGVAARMAEAAGLHRSIVNGALNPARQTLSQEAATRIADAYGVSLEFLFRGYRDGVSRKVQHEIDRWIADGRWDIEARAPAQDTKR